jgi:NAD(P)-dependent dehydrogenase (short-subunit alcohol dehydrogenase family)
MATGFIAEHAAVAGLTPEQTAANFLASVPLKRYVQPQEVAQMAVFLASEESSYVNAQSWAIDGGRTMI